MAIIIKKVSSKKELKTFIRFNYELYRGNPYSVPDLYDDMLGTFSPKRNAAFEFCEADYFLAYRNGHVVGRVAAIINRRANETWNKKEVRFGWIDFIDDFEVSEALLDTVAQWGKERGMEHIQGPMGIFDFDKEGMLVEDFDQLGSMITIYNPPYYPKHLEALGYEKEVDWVQIRIDVPEDVPAKYARVAKLSKEMFGLHVRKLTQKDIAQGYARKVFELLNQAYAPLFGYTELSDRQIDDYAKRYIPLMDLELVPIIENEAGELIGVAITMTSLSHALQKSEGRLLPFGWFHLVRALKWKRDEKAELFLIAVRPDYQGLGVNALVFDDLIPIYNKLHIRWAETGPQLETNVKELSQWKPLNPSFTKRRRCYTKRINEI